jgi:hypothetical protein
MSRAEPTPAPDPNQTVRIKSPPGGSPEKPDSSAAGSGRGWVVPVVIILLVVAAVVLIGVARRVEPRDTNQEPAPAASAEAVAAPVANALPEPPAVTESDTNAATPPAIPEPRLQGIGYSAAKPWAIVDGKTVYVGDRVGSRQVKEISSSTITLEDTNGGLQTLFLHK